MVNGSLDTRFGFSPEFVSKKEAAWALGSVALLKRAMHAGMLRIVRPGGRGCSTLIDYRSVVEFADYLREGGEVPLLPSEIKGKGRDHRRPAGRSGARQQ